MMAICVVPVVFLFVYSIFQPSHLCNLYAEFKQSDYRGILLNKYIDNENHNTRTIVIKSGENVFTMILPRDTSLFYNTVMIGDSVIKRKGDEFIAIQHNYSLLRFKLKWGCE